jgi:hypothetical protein
MERADEASRAVWEVRPPLMRALMKKATAVEMASLMTQYCCFVSATNTPAQSAGGALVWKAWIRVRYKSNRVARPKLFSVDRHKSMASSAPKVQMPAACAPRRAGGLPAMPVGREYLGAPQ